MTIPRAMVIPVVLAVVAANALVVWLPFLVLDFNHWENHLPVENWAGAARMLRHAYPFGWAIPVALALFGVGLALPRECQGLRVVWYGCLAAVVSVFWALWTIVVLNSFYAGLLPL